jgi:hypothetical protein
VGSGLPHRACQSQRGPRILYVDASILSDDLRSTSSFRSFLILTFQACSLTCCQWTFVKCRKCKWSREVLTQDSNGYSIQYTPFHPADSSQQQIRCLVYIGLPNNPQFMGALEPQSVAEKINASIGPSGENRDYLLHLEAALNDLSDDSHDQHVSDLARRVRALPSPIRTPGSQLPSENTLHKINSVEEQKEIEEQDS